MGFKGYNTDNAMENHLKQCGMTLGVLCDKKYKPMQTLHTHKRKVHMKLTAN